GRGPDLRHRPGWMGRTVRVRRRRSRADPAGIPERRDRAGGGERDLGRRDRHHLVPRRAGRAGAREDGGGSAAPLSRPSAALDGDRRREPRAARHEGRDHRQRGRADIVELPTAAQAVELMRRRRTARTHASEAVPPDALPSLLEAVRWAPSAANRQPWELVVITEERLKRRLRDAFVEGGGLIGVLTAVELADRGARVVILEKDDIGFEQSGRSVAAINLPGGDVNAGPRSMLRLTAEQWSGFEDRWDCGIDLNDEGWYIVVADAEDEAWLEIERATWHSTAGFSESQIMDAEAARKRFPQLEGPFLALDARHG